mgnify:CR=1 FL=1
MKCKRPSGGVRRSAPDAWRGRLDWPGGPLSRIGLRSGEIRKDHPITLDERFQTHGAVGRAGGGQNDGWNTGRRFTEPVIEPSGCLSGGKNRPNRSLFDQPCNIVALRFTDARISGALDAAARKHVPGRRRAAHCCPPEAPRRRGRRAPARSGFADADNKNPPPARQGRAWCPESAPLSGNQKPAREDAGSFHVP